MNLGDKIKKYRIMAGLSQKELGIKLGLTPSDADTRIRKYERNAITPKDAIRVKIADILNVDISALSDNDIDTPEDVLQALFLFEDKFSMEIDRTADKTTFTFDNSKIPHLLNSFFYDWSRKKEELSKLPVESSAELFSEYETWKSHFPKDIYADWNTQLESMKTFFVPYIQKAQTSAKKVTTISDLIILFRSMIQTNITIDVDTEIVSTGFGGLILRFSINELMDQTKPDIQNIFGEFLYAIDVLESYGMNVQIDMSTTEKGTQISYTLYLSSLMPLQSIIRKIQYYELIPNSDYSWVQMTFEQDYASDLKMFDIDIQTEIAQNYPH